MVAPARGLAPIDLGAVRQALSAGRRPKVVFTESAGQIAGQVGQVALAPVAMRKANPAPRYRRPMSSR